MTTSLESLLKDTLGNLSTLSPEKIRTLIQEAVKTFTSIREKTSSTDPEERAEAFQLANELKAALQKQMEDLTKTAQLDSNVLSSLSNQKDAFSQDTLQELIAGKKELDEFNEKMSPTPKTRGPTLVKKKSKKAWIAG